jgi:hypothetical protein
VNSLNLKILDHWNLKWWMNLVFGPRQWRWWPVEQQECLYTFVLSFALWRSEPQRDNLCMNLIVWAFRIPFGTAPLGELPFRITEGAKCVCDRPMGVDPESKISLVIQGVQ